jgi:hypothetical protein
MIACEATNIGSIVYCTFMMAVGYNVMFLGLLLIGITLFFLYKMNAPLSVSLPALFVLSYGLIIWDFVQPEFRILFYLLGLVGGGIVGYVFLKLFKY